MTCLISWLLLLYPVRKHQSECLGSKEGRGTVSIIYYFGLLFYHAFPIHLAKLVLKKQTGTESERDRGVQYDSI